MKDDALSDEIGDRVLQLVVTSFLVVVVVVLSLVPLVSEPLAFTTLVSHGCGLREALDGVEVEVFALTPEFTADVDVDDADADDEAEEEDVDEVDEDDAVFKGDLGSGVECRLSASEFLVTSLLVE